MKRTAEVTLRIDWDDAYEDHPATWTWTAGADPRPGIEVVHHPRSHDDHDVYPLKSKPGTFWCRTCQTHFTKEES